MPSTNTLRRPDTTRSITPRDHRSLARIFRAFHLVEAISDPTFDALKVLRGARAFLLGYVLENLAWEEGLMEPSSRAARRALRRHERLRQEIDAYAKQVWQYRARGEPWVGSQEDLVGLRDRIVRIQALLDHCARLESAGDVTEITARANSPR